MSKLNRELRGHFMILIMKSAGIQYSTHNWHIFTWNCITVIVNCNSFPYKGFLFGTQSRGNLSAFILKHYQSWVTARSGCISRIDRCVCLSPYISPFLISNKANSWFNTTKARYTYYGQFQTCKKKEGWRFVWVKSASLLFIFFWAAMCFSCNYIPVNSYNELLYFDYWMITYKDPILGTLSQ